jgi:UDP-N-acetylmuramyl pentapeptide phosphotransferase/UDP-N-acetylglucosamine-1-phosphate transferase
MQSAFYLGFAAFLTWLLCWPVYKLLVTKNIIDRPNERSSHDRPTARGGGIAIISVIAGAALTIFRFTAAPLLLLLSFLVLLLGIISFVDDLRSVHPGIRFGCHGISAILAICALRIPPIQIGNLGESFQVPFILLFAILFLWIAGYTNAFNFMDGINGIAGFQALTTGLGMALLVQVYSPGKVDAPVILSLVVAGAGLGFLPHNFPTARMFMGDVSSAPLGFLLSFLVVWLSASHGWELLIPLALMHANFVLDTAITLVRRALRGEKWYHPHREHFYQRLIRAGKSHSFVTGSETLLQVLVFLLLFCYLKSPLSGRLLLAVAVLLVWGMYFLYAEFLYRSRPIGRQLGGSGQSVSLPSA